MRAKLISVSKFSRIKKKSASVIVLVSFPVSGAQQENKTDHLQLTRILKPYF